MTHDPASHDRVLPRQTSSPNGRKRRRRGMALLLVMIGMIVCTILTAGFLSTQGTSIGIARNERDAVKCRAIAQTGIDMCYWLIRNKSDWRETMATGNWLNTVPIGDGTVTVAAADGDNTNNFADDPTQPVILTSTGTYDNRSFTLTASIRPTGGGTVFQNGNYIQGTISVGNGDLLTAATIDSYNSSSAPYNSLLPGSNAAFGSGSLINNALTVYFPSVFRGSYAAAPLEPLANVLNLIGLGALSPTSMSNAVETRNPGTVVFPNTTALTYRTNMVKSTGGPWAFPGGGRYDAVSANSCTIYINASGLYYVTGNLTLGNGATSVLQVNDGVSAAIVVDGSVTIGGKINLLGTTSQLAIYCNGAVTVSGGSVNLTGGNTSHLTIFGSPTCGQITVQNASNVYGSIYAPQAAVTMQNGSPKIYGAVIAHDLTLKNSSALHFDEALRALKISNITGGSAPGGTADYRMSIIGGPGLN